MSLLFVETVRVTALVSQSLESGLPSLITIHESQFLTHFANLNSASNAGNLIFIF